MSEAEVIVVRTNHDHLARQSTCTGDHPDHILGAQTHSPIDRLVDTKPLQIRIRPGDEIVKGESLPDVLGGAPLVLRTRAPPSQLIRRQHLQVTLQLRYRQRGLEIR